VLAYETGVFDSDARPKGGADGSPTA
jgi:hypothetical protein